MAPALTLIPQGVGAAYAPPGEAQSSYLVTAGERAICLDLGSGALNRLTGAWPPQDLAAVVITHLHPDHCADLLSLQVYMSFGPGSGRRLRLLSPAGLRRRLVAFVEDEDGWDEAFAFEDLARPEGTVDLREGLVLRYAEVPHSPPTFAVRVDFGDRSVCYGADCAPNEALPRLAEGCSVLLLECSFGAEPIPDGIPHLNGQAAGALARQAGASRLLLTHCYPEFDRDAAISAARAAFGGPVDWARQGEAVSA